jgi:hypothetical protein
MTPKIAAVGAALALVLVSGEVRAEDSIFTTPGNKMKRICHSENVPSRGPAWFPPVKRPTGSTLPRV